MSYILLFLLSGFLYYFLTRAIVLVYFIATEDDSNQWEKLLYGNGSDPSILIPLVGEFLFVYVMANIIFALPLVFVGKLANDIKLKVEERKKFKANREKYLSSLSDFGLKPNDIPKYINDPQSLKDYLAVWNQAIEDNRRAQTNFEKELKKAEMEVDQDVLKIVSVEAKAKAKVKVKE